jgi:hypothetical protein
MATTGMARGKTVAKALVRVVFMFSVLVRGFSGTSIIG